MSLKQMTLTERECRNVGGFFKEGVCSIPEQNVSVEKNITLALSHKEGMDNYVFSLEIEANPLSTHPGGTFFFNVSPQGILRFKYALLKEDLDAIQCVYPELLAITRKLTTK